MSVAPESKNVFGLIAIGTLVGLFSQRARQTLEKVARIVFDELPLERMLEGMLKQ